MDDRFKSQFVQSPVLEELHRAQQLLNAECEEIRARVERGNEAMHKFKMKVVHIQRVKAGYFKAYLDHVGDSDPGDVGPHCIEVEMVAAREQEFPLGAEFTVTFEPVAKPLSESAPASRFNPRFDVSKANPAAKVSRFDAEETLRRGEEVAAKAMSEDWRQT